MTEKGGSLSALRPQRVRGGERGRVRDRIRERKRKGQ